jgi:ubiquinone/menaquinone biosynthesis C-methylase UbiE
MTDNSNAVNIDAITARQKETWATGDFHQIARQNVCMGEALCEAVDPHAGERVLDIACGSGTAALIAARRYCDVTGIDFVPELIDRARRRAAADDLDVQFELGDAQSLQFPDASFDVVLSVYGVQFAPDQEKAAREMLRVCRRPPGLNRRCAGGPIPAWLTCSVTERARSGVRSGSHYSTTGLSIMPLSCS